jgi:MFS family permease
MTYFSICFSVAIGGALGPLLAPVTGVIAEEFRVSIEKSSLAAGYPLLAAGCMAYVSQIWAPIFGKRSNYIFSSLIYVATCAWCTQVRTFGEFLAARTVQGLGNGAFESIVISSIGDLYFVRLKFHVCSSLLIVLTDA